MMAAPHGAHISVLREAAVAALAPQAGGVFVDMTFGGGGYSQAILATQGTRVFGVDRDPVAIRRASGLVAAFPGRLQPVQSPFADIEQHLQVLGISSVDGIVFDLGVSSWQLDEPGRGFSFMHDGPLDMRMDSDGDCAGKTAGQKGGAVSGLSAGELIARATEKDLADIFYILGQEKQSRPIARAIVTARAEKAITRTRELAGIVETVTGARSREKIHPATRVFQAIRLFVNDELGQLVKALFAAERLLKPSGRLCLVTFHSLEDRIVKRFFATGTQPDKAQSRHLPPVQGRPPATFTPGARRPQLPGAGEIAHNPRARSAKLRYGIRTTAPARIFTPALLHELGMPRLNLTVSC